MKEDQQHSIFTEWLRLHRGLLFKVVKAYAFTVEDQNDLFQEIALQVWRSVPNFRGESAVTTWLYRISLNASLKWRSMENRHMNGRNRIEHAQNILQENQQTTPDERLSWLYEEIATLNEVDRSVCLLLLEDFNYKEMAEILGISENNVAVKIHRLKKHLIAQSKKYHEHEI